MIDNFELIRPFLSFESDDDFYFMQIIKRKKENPNMSKNNRIINFFCIKSIEQFDRLKDVVVNTCSYENARAYISLNKRSFRKAALMSIKITTEYLFSNNPECVKQSYMSACGKTCNESDKTWIVDIDTKDYSVVRDIQDIIENKCDPKNNENKKTKLIVPTKHGYHIISRPFNQKQFRELYSDPIDIHKDNPTILYVPDKVIE